MYLLSKNKKREEQQSQNSFHDKVAGGIVKKCIHMQTQWATYLQRKTKKFSRKAMKYYLVLFCLLSLACSFYLMIESFTGTSTKNLGVVPINVPIHSTQTGEEAIRSFDLITSV